MFQPTISHLEDAVLTLALLALCMALLVYLMMETYHRRQIARSARRLILSSKLFPPLGGKELRAFWSRSGRVDRELIEDLLVDMCRSPDAQVRAQVQRSVIESRIIDRWLKEIAHLRVSHRVRAAARLGFVRDSRGVQALVRAAEDSSAEVRLAVTMSLGRLRDPMGLPGLLKLAARPAKEIPDLTLAAALAACAKDCPARVLSLLKAPQTRQRIVGAWALSEVADATVLDALLATARDPEPEVRAKVARALARLKSPKSSEALRRLARDPHWFVRVRALDALGKLQAPAEEGAMLAGLKDNVREVRYRAAFALRNTLGMRGDLVAKVFATQPRSSFDSLISEWDHAGFIWEAVAGLSTRDYARFLESQEILRTLIAAGVVRGLEHMILVFPDVKVRLRLLRLFLEVPLQAYQAELLALAGQPQCDHRVTAAIRKALPSLGTPGVATVKPSMV